MIRKENPPANNLYLYLALCMLIVGGLVMWTSNAAPGDFGNYYYGSKFLAEGKFNIDVYETYKFNLAVYDEGLRNFFLNYTPVPPITPILYLPFTLFNFTSAKLLWNILNALLWVWKLFRLQGYFKFPAFYTLIITLVLIIPLKSNFQQGQMYILVTALLLEGFIATEKQLNLKAGVLFGLAIMLKIFPAIVIGYLVFNRNWRAASLTVVSILALLLFSLVAMDVAIWQNYIFKILPRLAAGEINNPYATSYQSFTVLARNLFVYDKLHNQNFFWNAPKLFMLLALGFKLLMFVCLIGVTKAKISPPAKFSIWCLGGMLVSGYGSTYGLVELAVFLLIVNDLKGKWLLLGICLLGIVAANLPLAWLNRLPFGFQFLRLYCLVLVFLLLVNHFKPIVSPFWLGLAILMLIGKWMSYNRDFCAERYLLEKEDHILIYDFKIDGSQLTYSYFDDSGPAKQSLALPFSVELIEEADIAKVSNLTCRGKKGGRGAPTENILKAVVIDKQHVIYLSDAHRGICFYTLRIMDLKDSETK